MSFLSSVNSSNILSSFLLPIDTLLFTLGFHILPSPYMYLDLFCGFHNSYSVLNGIALLSFPGVTISNLKLYTNLRVPISLTAIWLPYLLLEFDKRSCRIHFILIIGCWVIPHFFWSSPWFWIRYLYHL